MSDGEDPIAATRSRVAPPAIALVITGALGALLALFNLGMLAITDEAAQAAQLEGIPPNLRPMFESMMAVSPFVQAAFHLASLAVSVFIVVAALRMHGLRNRGLAIAAAILSIMNYPACCCCLQLPLGIWALVALLSPSAERGFAAMEASRSRPPGR